MRWETNDTNKVQWDERCIANARLWRWTSDLFAMDYIANIPYPREPTAVPDAGGTQSLNRRSASDYPSATRRSCTVRTRAVLMLPTRAVTSRDTLEREDHANEHVRPAQPVKTGNLLVSTYYCDRTIMIRATGHNMDGVEVFSLGYSEDAEKLEAKCLTWKGLRGRRKTLWLSGVLDIGAKRAIKRCPTCRLQAYQCRRVDAPGHLNSCDSIVDIQLCKALDTSSKIYFVIRTKYDFVYYCSISRRKIIEPVPLKSPLKSNPGQSYELYIQKRQEQRALLASTLGSRNDGKAKSGSNSNVYSSNGSDNSDDASSDISSSSNSSNSDDSGSSSSGSSESDPRSPDKPPSEKRPANHFVVDFDGSLILSCVGSFHLKMSTSYQSDPVIGGDRHIYAMVSSPYSVGYIAVVYANGNVEMYDMTSRASANMPHLIGGVDCKGIIQRRAFSKFHKLALCACFGHHPFDVLLGSLNRVYCARVQEVHAGENVAPPKVVYVLPRRGDRRQNECITNIQRAKQHFHIIVGTCYSVYVVDVCYT